MARKILGGTLIILSLSLLILSLIGVGGIWYYKKPLTAGSVAKLTEFERQLGQAQTALQNAQGELVRALRFVDSAEKALESLSEQTTMAKEFLDTVTGVLDKTIKPSLATSREKIDEAQKTMDDLRAAVQALNQIPFVNIQVPDQGILSSFTEVMDSFESEIARIEEIADQASTFLGDTSYLMGGDLQETRGNIKELQTVVDEYEAKIGDWREQVAEVIDSLPRWINRVSITLTIFLLWFSFSQFGLVLHGLNIYRGGNPLKTS